MARLHLFEWEDQSWCPALFRNFITEHLQFLAQLVGFFKPVTAKLAEAMSRLNETRVVDMCSGGGGPWPSLIKEFERQESFTPQVTLTDLYPNEQAFDQIEKDSHHQIKGRRSSVSAFDAPDDLQGFRTIFTGFHHFKPEHARLIIKDAVENKNGLAIFEAQERKAHLVMLVPFVIFLVALIFTPFVGRITLPRLFFTYVIPLCPLLFAWDGFASCLRTYSPQELHALCDEFKSDEYQFEIGQIPIKLLGIPAMNITYLIGSPQAEDANRLKQA